MGKTPDEWSYGDLDSGFKNAALVLDETFVTPDTSHQTLETRSAMAYWQNGKVYIHTGTQSTAQTLPAIARWLNIESRQGCFHQRIHRRRIRQQDHRRRIDDHPRASGEENECSGDDAHQPRGGDLHRTRAPQFSGPDESRLLQRRADHGPRHVRDLRQRSLRRSGRCSLVGPHRLPVVPAASHALARGDGADEYAAPQRAEFSGRAAGDRHHRADHRESRAQARSRPGGNSPHQLPRGQGAVRTGGAGKAAVCHQRIPQRSARPRRGAIQMERAGCAHSEEDGHESSRRRRIAELLRWRHDRIRRASRHQAGWPDHLPVWNRQSGNGVGDRRSSRGRRGSGRAVGEMRSRVGQHDEEPSLHLRLRRQPDDSRDDARRVCRGDGRQEEAPGNRGQEARRQAGAI